MIKSSEEKKNMVNKHILSARYAVSHFDPRLSTE
jgi:hypothetical protein